MAMLVKKGSFGAEAATGNKAYTGIGFQPKALILWATPITSDGFNIDAVHSFAVMTGPTQRRCISTIADDNVDPSTSHHARRNSNMAITIVQAGSVSGGSIKVEADLVSFDADGFTLNYSTVGAGLFYIIHYLALGGSDITNAYVSNFTMPAATGNYPITGVGFQPDFVLGCTVNTTAVANSTHLHHHLFAFKSPTQRGCASVRGRNSISPTQTAVYQRTDKALSVISSTSDVLIEADHVSMDADGFTLNFPTVGAGGELVPFLALKGGNYFVGSDTQKTSTGTKAKTGIGFTPVGLLFFGTNRAADSTLDLTQAKMSIGGTDGTAEGCTWFSETDNVTTTDANTLTSSSKVFKHATNPNNVDAECDTQSLDSDGYTLSWTTADAVAREFIVVAFGSSIGYTDAATISLKLSPSGTDVYTQTGVFLDSGTLGFKLTPSSTDIRASVDSATARLTLTPSFGEVYTPVGGKLLGAYDGGQNVSSVDAFKAWLGAPVPIAADFLAGDVWGGIEGPGWILDPWNGKYRLNLGVPMLPDTEVPSGAGDTATISTKLTSGASGTFNSHFATLAANLIAKGQANAYLRLGWEFNGSWYRWRADANPTAFKNYWIQIVNTMRGVAGANFKFIWNPTRGAESLSGQPTGTESAYPGDAYVDVIGLDIYDSQYGVSLSDAARWDRILNDPYCISWALDFAAARIKQIAFPEWGIVKATGAPRYGGGDSASFINHMADVIFANDCAYHSYWDYDASDIQSKLSNNSAPNAGAAYITRFGTPAPPPPPPPPAPTTTVIPIRPEQTAWSLRHYDHADNALGDVFPKSPEFAIYLNRVGYCNYGMDLDHPLAKRQYTSPYQTDFQLFRKNKPIMGGIHTSVSVDLDQETLTVSGLDWQHYLELREWPYDPADALANTYLASDRDIALVVKDILTRILAEPNSLQLNLNSIIAINRLINYKIDVGDTANIMSKLTDLAKKAPGFDFEITYDRRFNIYAPQKGTDNGITLAEAHNIYNLSYVDNGPVATHTTGKATAGSSQIGVVVNSTNQSGYRRLDATQDFQDITSEEELISSTFAESDRNSTPHREITCKVIQDAIDIWEEVEPGDTIHLEGNIQYDQFNSEPFRVVGMLCNPNDEGDEEWSLTLDDGTLSL